MELLKKEKQKEAKRVLDTGTFYNILLVTHLISSYNFGVLADL